MISSIEDLVEYLLRFHRIWMDSPGLESNLVPGDLPYGLALMYRKLGKLVGLVPGPKNSFARLFGVQDRLFPLDRLVRLWDDRFGEMIVFCDENQSIWSCLCQAGHVDPPVYSDLDDPGNLAEPEYQIVSDSLNHFLTTLCLRESVFSAPFLCQFKDIFLHEALRPDVQLSPLWERGKIVYESLYSFYEIPGADVLIMMGDGDSFQVAAHSDKVLEFFTDQARAEHFLPYRNGASWRRSTTTYADGTSTYIMSAPDTVWALRADNWFRSDHPCFLRLRFKYDDPDGNVILVAEVAANGFSGQGFATGMRRDEIAAFADTLDAAMPLNDDIHVELDGGTRDTANGGDWRQRVRLDFYAHPRGWGYGRTACRIDIVTQRTDRIESRHFVSVELHVNDTALWTFIGELKALAGGAANQAVLYGHDFSSPF